MEQIASDLRRYFKEMLDIDVQPEQWSEKQNLPIFLRNMYDFFQICILGKPCLITALKEDIELTPTVVRKHMFQVEKKWYDEIIYLQQKVTLYNRKRLIQQKIPFIVPLNQMYLPFLGIDLRENFRKVRKTKAGLSPSAQVILLYYLINTSQLRMTPNFLANELGFSITTMTRAFDELDAAGLVSIAREGCERVLWFNHDKKQVWETALDHMHSPVKKRLWIKFQHDNPPGTRAGLSALSSYSNLSEPANPVLALERQHWRKVKAGNGVKILNIIESDAIQLEVWSYSPMMFNKNGVVDRFSLFLSMKENNDEQIQSSLEKMMENVIW